MTAAAHYDIEADQYATWSLLLTWTDDLDAPIDLTGYTAEMQVRDKAGTIWLDLTEVGGGITLGGAAGTILPAVPAGGLALLPTEPTRLAYDLLLTSSGGQVTRLMEGDFVVIAGVTP